MFGVTSFAVAQVANFKAGDKNEVLSNGTWYKADVLEAKDGSYKIHYDGWTSTWDEWVTVAKMRSIGGTSPANAQTASNASTTNQPGNQSATQNNAMKYKPGERVECDKASIDSWEKGTIMPFLKNDFKIVVESTRVNI